MTITVNNKIVKYLKFSGGECHVCLDRENIGDETFINAFIKNSDDLMSLLLIVDAVRRCHPHSKVYLTLPYLPYARQDRVCEPGEALSISVLANLINTLDCSEVTVHDPHSDVSLALLKNVRIKSIPDFIMNSCLESVIEKDHLVLVSPDAGAEKKVLKLVSKLAVKYSFVDLITASKVRDTKTRSITQTKVSGIKKGSNYLIVDDICDGGRTFVELAKVMKQQGASKIYLYVTHGIFSHGFSRLLKYIDEIYCVNSWVDASQQPKLTILEG